ncbi:MAG TPA: ATP-binding protein [Solirubrobacteraceae bacterium]|nr:ATP-binding protein [Solirubrobacteraceae bacterium]
MTRVRTQAFGEQRPPLWLGLTVSIAAVAAATAVIYPLGIVASPVSLSVVYLPGVLLVSAYWGLRLGLVTSLLSAAAFNFFHLPPVGQFTISDGRNWVALGAFILVAVVVSTIAEIARTRTVEAERRRAEADLAAGLARELLIGVHTEAALGGAARRIAQALTIPSAAIELGEARGSQRRLALPLRGANAEQIATLLVPSNLSADTTADLRTHVVPSLEALVGIALHRDAVQAEAIETAALRRSDEIKTALLRAVSHNLRSPVTAVVTAGHALGASSLTDTERVELSSAVVEEGERLWSLIDKLLDLSRLEAGRAEPREDWTSIEEVVLAARDDVHADAAQIQVSLDGDVPAVRADAGQLEHVFVNLLENARRYSGGLPVAVQARRLGDTVVIRVVDQGPGIARADRERIFEPFYRGRPAAGGSWTGSGLGLSIAKGFVEANGGRIWVDSLPGQGSSFVVELPLPEAEPLPVI